MFRSGLKRALTLAALAVGVGVGLWAALPGLAERWVLAELRRAGVEQAELDVRRIGPGEVRVVDLRIGADDLTVAELRAEYAPRDLLAGRVRRLEISGLRLRARVGPEGVSFGGLDPLFAGGAEAEPGPPAVALPAEVVALRDAELVLLTPAGDVSVPFAAMIRAGDDEWHRLDARVAVRSSYGEIAGRLSAAALPEGRIEGRFDVADGHLAYGDVRAGDLTGEVTFAGSTGGLERLRLRLAPARLELPPLSFPEPRLEAELEGGSLSVAATLTAAEGVRAVATLRADGLGGRVPDAAERGADAGTEAAVGGEVALRVTADDGSPTPGLTVRSGLLELSGDLAYADGELAVLLREGELRASALRLQEVLATRAPLALRLAPNAEHKIVADFRDGDGMVLRHRLSVQPAEAALLLRIGGENVGVSGQTPRLILEGAIGPSAPTFRETVTTSGGRLALPDYALALRGINAEATFSGDGAPLRASLRVDDLRQLDDPPYVAPLWLSATASGGEGGIEFSLHASDAGGRLTGEARGTHDPATGTGRARVRLRAPRFEPRGAQPQALFPILGNRLGPVSGRLALAGIVTWGERGLAPDLELLVEDLSLAPAGVAVRAVNGLVRLDGLAPPSTPPGQLLAFGAVEAGLPLTDGTVRFRLRPDGTVAVERAEARVAGGQVAAEGELGLAPEGDRSLVLDVAGVELGRLLELLRIDGLSGTGRLSGRVPIRLEGGAVVVDGGRLESGAGGGVLRYRPGRAPEALAGGGQGVELALAALQNFHYDRLIMTLAGRSDDEMRVGLRIEGRNPDFMEGYPFVFNFDLSGEIAQVIETGLRSYRVPERVREQMREFGE